MEEENTEAQKEVILSKKERNQRIIRVVSLIVILIACIFLLITVMTLVKHSQEIIQAAKTDPCGLCYKNTLNPGNSQILNNFSWNSS